MAGKRVTRRYIAGHEYQADLLPKIKIELVVREEIVEATIATIIENASTGKIGDGKIFISKIDDAIRIRNKDRGISAL